MSGPAHIRSKRQQSQGTTPRGLRFDHALIAVFDLKAAVAEFESLGFTVIPGGQHSSGLTENALVTFADGNYLELIAPTSRELLEHPPPPGPGNYLNLFDSGEGFAGYAFDVLNLEAEVKRVRSIGIDIGDPQAGGRLRPDGVELAWRTAMLPDTRSPFFLIDDTPRARRIRTESEITTHSNGAQGVVEMIVPVAHLRPAVRRHENLLGLPSRPGSPVLGAPTADLQIGAFRLKLVAAVGETGLLAEYLVRRGELPYVIHIRTTSARHAAEIDARGARIELVHG